MSRCQQIALLWNYHDGRFDGEGWVRRLAALVLPQAAMPHCSQHDAGMGAEAAASAHASERMGSFA